MALCKTGISIGDVLEILQSCNNHRHTSLTSCLGTCLFVRIRHKALDGNSTWEMLRLMQVNGTCYIFVYKSVSGKPVQAKTCNKSFPAGSWFILKVCTDQSMNWHHSYNQHQINKPLFTHLILCIILLIITAIRNTDGYHTTSCKFGMYDTVVKSDI